MLQEADYREWKHVVQEITRFLKADSPFMNLGPLKYDYAFDPPGYFWLSRLIDEHDTIFLRNFCCVEFYVRGSMCHELTSDFWFRMTSITIHGGIYI